jgi:hypothetical protein
MYTLEKTREIDGAILLDDNGRYYAEHSEGYRVYGYNTAWGCAYVCYTCGHLCDCGDEE